MTGVALFHPNSGANPAENGSAAAGDLAENIENSCGAESIHPFLLGTTISLRGQNDFANGIRESNLRTQNSMGTLLGKAHV